MKYLIFRTDRIGDFLITLPLLKSIKRNNPNSIISVVSSPKNIDFIKKNIFVDEVFLLESNNLKDKFKLFFKLNKYKYEAIIISDKKNRSIILGLFLKGKNKIFNVSKIFQKRILNFFFKNTFLDNDELKNVTVNDILKKNCNSLNMELNNKDYIFFDKNQFEKEFSLKKSLNLDKFKYIILHYDEKWELENYSKLYKKAKTLTDIKIYKNGFINFLTKLSENKSMKIIITTGYLDTNIISELKKEFSKISSSLYKLNLKNEKCFLITNQNFFSLSHLISKSNLFISCHGAFTHVAANYGIKIIDIIEENKEKHYSRITSHMKNYKTFFRKDSSKLLNQIINYS